MQGLQSVRLYGTTDGDGNLTVTGAAAVFGLLYGVRWIDGGFADGVDAVISQTKGDGVSETLLTLTNANDDAVYYPRHNEHDNTGASIGPGAMPVLDGVPKMVVSSGGNAAAGGCILYYTQP